VRIGVSNPASKKLLLLNKKEYLSLRGLDGEGQSDKRIKEFRPVTDGAESQFTHDMSMCLDLVCRKKICKPHIRLA